MAQIYATWATSLPPSHEIISVVTRPKGLVASLGKVLGDRTTLYKYLNPHMFAVLTSSPNSCGVRVLDGAKGSTLYSAIVGKAPGGCDVKATFVENWLVYVYWDGEFEGVGMTKGYRAVSVELYEGRGVDDKTSRSVIAFGCPFGGSVLMLYSSSDMSSLSNESLIVNAIEQAFVFPHRNTAIATTSTKFGVTTKDLIGMLCLLVVSFALTNPRPFQWRMRNSRFSRSLGEFWILAGRSTSQRQKNRRSSSSSTTPSSLTIRDAFSRTITRSVLKSCLLNMHPSYSLRLLGGKHTPYSDVTLTTREHVARVCVRTRLVFHARCAVGHVRCAERQLQQSAARVDGVWPGDRDHDHETHGT